MGFSPFVQNLAKAGSASLGKLLQLGGRNRDVRESAFSFDRAGSLQCSPFVFLWLVVILF